MFDREEWLPEHGFAEPPKPPFKKLHDLSFKNKELLDLESHGSCFYCYYTPRIDEIERWTDDGQTAICPKCNIDSILPGDINIDLLVEMSKRYFQ